MADKPKLIYDPIEVDMDEKLPCGLSRREIAQLRRTGVKRPDFIPWAEWHGPHKLSHRHMLICYLAAMGRNAPEIAEEIGCNLQAIKKVIYSEIGQRQIQVIREVEFHGKAVEQQIDQLAPAAVRVYDRILNSETAPESLKFKVAYSVLDRKMGKPLSKVDIGGNLVSELYTMLSEKKTKELPSPKDTIDAEFTPVKTRNEGRMRPSDYEVIEKQKKEAEQKARRKVERDIEEQSDNARDIEEWLDKQGY